MKGSSARFFRRFSSESLFHERMSRPTQLWLLGVGIAVLGYDVYYHHYLRTPHIKALDPSDFNPFTLYDIVPVNHDTSLFRFKARVLQCDHGQSVDAPSHVIIKDDSCQIARPYTPIHFDKESVDILVKKYPDGSVSRMLHAQSIGDQIYMRGPLLSCHYRPNCTPHLCMMAAGTGITPMYQLLKSILANQEDTTQLQLFYANKSVQDILLFRELQALQEKFPSRLKIHYTVEQLEDPSVIEDVQMDVGRLKLNQLREQLPNEVDKCAVLVCGPDGFIHSVAGPKSENGDQAELGGMLKQLGFQAHQVFKL
jgi:cytochrome-b5 reductase